MTANDFENAKAATTAAFALLMVSKVETGLYCVNLCLLH